jgi:hypothetical protein
MGATTLSIITLYIVSFMLNVITTCQGRKVAVLCYKIININTLAYLRLAKDITSQTLNKKSLLCCCRLNLLIVVMLNVVAPLCWAP